MSYRALALSFFRSGLLGFGGGPSAIPLIRYEIVERYKLIDDTTFAEILAIANALPGPIATKIAAYVGYRIKKTLGAVVAVLSHILPTVLTVCFLVGSIQTFNQSKVVNGMVHGVVPVIIVMLGVMTFEFVKKSWKSYGFIKGNALLILSVLLLIVYKFHAAVVVASFIIMALVVSTIQTNRYKMEHALSPKDKKRKND